MFVSTCWHCSIFLSIYSEPEKGRMALFIGLPQNPQSIPLSSGPLWGNSRNRSYTCPSQHHVPGIPLQTLPRQWLEENPSFTPWKHPPYMWHVQKSKTHPLAHSFSVGWSRLYHTGHVKCLYNSCDWRHVPSSLGPGKSTKVYKERLHI